MVGVAMEYNVAMLSVRPGPRAGKGFWESGQRAPFPQTMCILGPENHIPLYDVSP